MSSTKTWAAHWAAIFVLGTKAFFSINEEDTSATAGTKIAKTAAMRTIYAVADYWLMALSAVFIIAVDKLVGRDWFLLFISMWVFDLAVAYLFVLTWKRTGEDVTLGESFRHAVDAVRTKSIAAARVAIGLVCLKATFWDGPEHIVIFFSKELGRDTLILLTLLALTAVQAAIWTPLYILGFDSIVDFSKYITG